jgi:general secretion pathway protein H
MKEKTHLSSPRKRGEGWVRGALSGFTLLEIMLVVVIVAVIVTLTSPKFQKTFTTIQLANTAQELAQLMRFIKTKAVSEKTIYGLKLDLANRKYYVKKEDKSSSVSYEISRIIPKDVNIAATTGTINFYPDGSIDAVSVFIFRGKEDYNKEIDKMIQKDFEVGQIQSLSRTEYIYTIKTQPTIGKILIEVPE